VEFDFGAPQAPTAYQPSGVAPLPQDKQAGLAVGLGATAAAAAGGVGLAIYADEEANKPNTITRIVTPAPRVVYVPAQIEIDVLANGQKVGQYPPPPPPPAPVRLYEEEGENVDARRPADIPFLPKAPIQRRDLVILIFALAVACCCCVSCVVVYGLFCSKKGGKKKRALGATGRNLMMPAATGPIRRKEADLEKAETVMKNLVFKPGRRLGVTIDNDTGEILEVKEKGQAAEQGVTVGDKIVQLNGFRFTPELLQQYEEGMDDYDVTMSYIDLDADPTEGSPLPQAIRAKNMEAPPDRNPDFVPNPYMASMPPLLPSYAANPYVMNLPMSMPMSMPTSYNYVTPASYVAPVGSLV
jgi:hypothetical protein